MDFSYGLYGGEPVLFMKPCCHSLLLTDDIHRERGRECCASSRDEAGNDRVCWCIVCTHTTRSITFNMAKPGSLILPNCAIGTTCNSVYLALSYGLYCVSPWFHQVNLPNFLQSHCITVEMYN